MRSWVAGAVAVCDGALAPALALRGLGLLAGVVAAMVQMLQTSLRSTCTVSAAAVS